MSTKETRKVVRKAVLDEEFRKTLFSDPDKALDGYDLTSEEIGALRSIPAETIDDFANKLEDRLSMSFLAFGAEMFGDQASGGEAAGGYARGGEAAGGSAAGGHAGGATAVGHSAAGGQAAGGSAAGGQAAGGSALGGQALGSGGDVGVGRPANWLQRLAAALGIGGSAGGGIDKNYY